MKKNYFIALLICFTYGIKTNSQDLLLNISGNNILETSKIDSCNYSKKHKNYKSISKEVLRIQNLLYKQGYIENKLNKLEKFNDSTYKAKIELNKLYKNITIHYKANTIPKNWLNGISNTVTDTHFVLTFKDIESSLKYLNSKLSEQGYPFSKIKLNDITTNKNALSAHLDVAIKNKKRTINKIKVEGYKKFPKSYLKHFLKIKKNQTFNLNAINKKTELLKTLKFANQIKAPEVLFSKDSTTLYLYVKKAQTNTFDGFLGFGTNEDTNRLEFDGFLNLGLVNNLNYGETFRLLYKSDEGDQKTFQASLSLPYLFKSPVGVDLELNIFRRDTSFSTTRQAFKLNYQINSKQKIAAGITGTKSSNLLPTNFVTQIEDFDTSYYTLAYNYIKPELENLLFPVNASFSLETNFGNRTSNISKEQQSLILANAFKVFNLNARNSIYIRLNAEQLNSDTFFENELRRFGGINSIRGFEENSILASQFGLINSEYRYKLSNGIYVHTIIDAAYFENKINDSRQKLFGYGLGLGILTKSGLLKLNYANGKSEDQKFKLSNSKIHISLKATF